MTTIPTTVGQPEAVVLAEKLGHTMEFDSTNPRSKVSRWSCVRCDRAILDDGTTIYGSAKREPCTGVTHGE